MTQIMPLFRGIKSNYDQYLKPTFDDLWDGLNTHVIPALKEFWDWLSGKQKGNNVEVFNTIRRTAKEGFEVLGWVISNIVMPAFHQLADWYRDHKSELDTLGRDALWLSKQFQKLATMLGAGGLMDVLIVIAALFGALIWVITGVIIVITWIVEAVKALIHWIHELWNNPITAYFDAWKTSVSSVVTALQNAASTVQMFASRIPGMIRAAFADMGTVLYNAGASIIQGLINGIESKLNQLWGLLGSITTRIALIKGPPERDAKLLRPAGQLVMQGFMHGIQDMIPSLDRQLMGITGRIAPTVNVQSTVLSGGALSNSPIVHKTIIQNITVNQADRSARQLGTELGFQLAGRS